MKKLMAKKNNKGFSLVELIVVVLIMGIIAVALAPQVMKWVGTSRTNSDKNTAKDLKSAIQIAYADFEGDGGKLTAAESFTVGASGIGTINNTAFSTKVAEVLNGETPQTAAGGNFTVSVTTTGQVTVSY